MEKALLRWCAHRRWTEMMIRYPKVSKPSRQNRDFVSTVCVFLDIESSSRFTYDPRTLQKVRFSRRFCTVLASYILKPISHQFAWSRFWHVRAINAWRCHKSTQNAHRGCQNWTSTLMHANTATLYFRCRNRSSSTVPNSAFTRPDTKITKILDSVAFSDDGHSKLSRNFHGNLHFVSTKPPLLTKPCKNSRKTDDFEAAAFGGPGG